MHDIKGFVKTINAVDQAFRMEEKKRYISLFEIVKSIPNLTERKRRYQDLINIIQAHEEERSNGRGRLSPHDDTSEAATNLIDQIKREIDCIGWLTICAR